MPVLCCSQNRACTLDVAERPAAIRDELELQADRAGAPRPAFVGCSWISIDPPVCSAPKCRRAFARQLAETGA